MIPPAENALAAYPPTEEVGGVRLGPLTLVGVIRLAERGIDTARKVPCEQIVFAAFVLSGEGDVGTFARRVKGRFSALENAVERQFNRAFETWISPAAGGRKSVGHATPHGLGWTLEYAEWLCAEYGWSLADALATPVSTVFALAAAARQRHGGHHAGLDYLERRYRADVKSGKVKAINPFDTGKA